MQVFVILACIIAASGGILFGYDGGITGGVESMEQFKTWQDPQVLLHSHVYLVWLPSREHPRVLAHMSDWGSTQELTLDIRQYKRSGMISFLKQDR